MFFLLFLKTKYCYYFNYIFLCFYLQLGFSTNVYPSDINVLKDMKLAFVVSVSKYNVQRNTNQYTIYRISDDEIMIEELEKNLELQWLL